MRALEPVLHSLVIKPGRLEVVDGFDQGLLLVPLESLWFHHLPLVEEERADDLPHLLIQNAAGEAVKVGMKFLIEVI